MTAHPESLGTDRRLGIASRWALAIAIAITVAALVGSLIPRAPMPAVPFGDKLVHAAGYAALGFFWRGALRGPTSWLLAAVCAFGVLIECLQWLTPWRAFELADMVANAAGAAGGLWLFAAFQALRQRLGKD